MTQTPKSYMKISLDEFSWIKNSNKRKYGNFRIIILEKEKKGGKIKITWVEIYPRAVHKPFCICLISRFPNTPPHISHQSFYRSAISTHISCDNSENRALNFLFSFCLLGKNEEKWKENWQEIACLRRLFLYSFPRTKHMRRKRERKKGEREESIPEKKNPKTSAQKPKMQTWSCKHMAPVFCVTTLKLSVCFWERMKKKWKENLQDMACSGRLFLNSFPRTKHMR